ncbi:hypothetical protein C9994_14680 [Marivirga lumbricoides]|uniref:Lipoprotein n=1 Tax=Marivirga lumbricoides TaxID=1046115 RepID=A0A2T4DDR9_9BACT|nr:hypothetical protein C9994_14680 [Marivirga lumbricoides]
MNRLAILFIISSLLLASCKDKMVCAAFQSSYILDPQKQKERFSYFKNDSLILEASVTTHKTDIYGLKEKEYGFWKQQKLLQIEQKDVLSDEMDSLLANRGKEPVVDFDSLEIAMDTLQLTDEDSDAWDNTKRFHYNVDFVKYMLLVGNDVLLAQAAARDSAQAKQNREQSAANDSTKSGGGFMKGLFGGKKDKKEKDKGKRRSENEGGGEANEAAAVPEENPTTDTEEGEG